MAGLARHGGGRAGCGDVRKTGKVEGVTAHTGSSGGSVSGTGRAIVRTANGDNEDRMRPAGKTEREAMTTNAAKRSTARAAADDGDLIRQFDAAWNRGLELRVRHSFIKTYKPVMDDAPFRAWTTMADYRRWCDENVPDWLGYGNH